MTQRPGDGSRPPRPPLHSLVDSLQVHLDRWLHPIRRTRARRQLGARVLPHSVLFLCTGNLYRSPFAAECLRSYLPPPVRDRLQVGSAGFFRPGRAAPPDAVHVARGHGIDLSEHRSQIVASLTVREWEMFVVVDSAHAMVLRKRFGIDPARVIMVGDLDPEPIDRRVIRDPWNEPLAVLESTYARIARCTRVLAACLSAMASDKAVL